MALAGHSNCSIDLGWDDQYIVIIQQIDLDNRYFYACWHPE
jgi:hypothetical protein